MICYISQHSFNFIYILLCQGDILFDYGCYGFLVFVFRLWEPKKLLAAEAGKIIESLALALNEKEYQHEFKKIKLAIADKGPRPLFRFLNWDKISHSGKRKKKNA